MRLFLHAGTEKTGSSFLQMLAARNRETLSRSGIYFPNGGKREKDMQEGRVSPGNGKSLHDALKRHSAQAVRTLLSAMVTDATAAQCDTILISNENIVELFAVPGSFELLQKTCQDVGIKEMHGLVIIREPVDQALSLYKHRAKSGAVSPIDHWIKSEFYTLNVLQRFVELKSRTDIVWTVKKYEKIPKRMSDSFFSEWVKVKHPVPYSDTIVNPSLTLSELLFLKGQYKTNPSLVPYCYKALLNLNPAVKAGDKELENAYRRVIAENLFPYKEVIRQLNALIDDGNQLTFPEVETTGEITVSDNMNLTLSEQQVASILQVQQNFFTAKGRIKNIAYKLKGRIAGLIK